MSSACSGWKRWMEGKGLKGTFHFWIRRSAEPWKNKTGYDLRAVIAVPGYCAPHWRHQKRGDDHAGWNRSDSVRESRGIERAEDLPEIEKIIWTGVIYNHMPNRSDNSLSLESWQAMTIRSSLTADTKRMESRITIRKCLWTLKEAGVVYRSVCAGVHLWMGRRKHGKL